MIFIDLVIKRKFKSIVRYFFISIVSFWHPLITSLYRTQTPSLDNTHSFDVNYQIIYTIWGSIRSLKKINRLTRDSEQYNKVCHFFYFLQNRFLFPQLPMIYEKRYNTPIHKCFDCWAALCVNWGLFVNGLENWK